MPIIQDQIAVAANTVNDDILQAKRNAQIDPGSGGASVTIYTSASATGLMITGFAGQRNVIERSRPSNTNVIPVIPDDLFASGILMRANERLYLQVENTTAGALTLYYRVEFMLRPRS